MTTETPETRTLDIRKTEDLIEGLRRACIMGHRHGKEGKKQSTIQEIRVACRIFISDEQLRRAIRSAYVGAWNNGKCSYIKEVS